MAIQVGSFPHPVLGREDDVASNFEVSSCDVSFESEDIVLRFRIKHNDPNLKQLMQSGVAQMHAKLVCSSTMYAGALDIRKTQAHPDGFTYECSIDQRELRGTATVEFNVVATEAIRDFSWARQHADYGGEKFDINVGDFLALGGTSKFDVAKKFDPIQPPLGSCFRIVAAPNGTHDVSVTFDDEQVTIWVPESFVAGLRSQSGLPHLQISLIVLPALMETIDRIKRNGEDVAEEDMSNRAWFAPVKELIESVREGGLFETAQRILGHPIEQVLTTPLFEDQED